MIGILVVTHGNLGKEFLKTAEIIIGKAENAEALALAYEDDVLVLKDVIREKITQLDQGDGVMVFTDLFGGSPNNAVAANLKDLKFKGITGLNLPMLIECITMREQMDAEELAQHLQSAGKDGVKLLNELYKV